MKNAHVFLSLLMIKQKSKVVNRKLIEFKLSSFNFLINLI